MRIPDVPYVVTERLREHPDEAMPDGLILTQPWPAGPADKRRDQVSYYQYKADPARSTSSSATSHRPTYFYARVCRAACARSTSRRSGLMRHSC